MVRLRLSLSAAGLLLAGALAACGAKERIEPLEPPVRVVETTVTKPVPCPALAAMGAEPAYVDTDEALQGASNVAERAKLYTIGRKQRIQRLAEYTAARVGCLF